ncbi:MAG: UDP-3-O-(3-hydroxymyristoyl)glucosamine N-acyltransferase [Candidatus Krumholzibacteria bacterium]|nr:UDP-3-O-(3-hydroxymyristoyl)glucosamine N-acyltransferase [Candidatus Krumholzibacteria bacterium]MDH4337960.1 UDP-3-O-(3-hydroxymyristoyl)glucosamine N-acyltransferase [Candidatus Krumholzibacteria bacterium]MDH5271214.1 UDP-3-O-(3-hydroxymyristoyl)glucosamine N-acyltransferase [Candidatus Krumholzibacteria bacterium]MDH5627557.1 UDP-3-O-(3-hydroxymyristoyl)glucosamine N-acyltransferase [Candidatus Krumholzibacteria bacterium]
MGTRSYRLCELADIVGGKVVGDGDVEICGVAGIREAMPGDITFIANPRYAEFLSNTRASAVIGGDDLSPLKPLIRIGNPYYAFLQVLNLFAVERAVRYARGVHESAVVHADVVLGDDVSIGAFCQISAGARIGDRTTILPGTFVGEGCVIGPDCLIYPNVTIREGSEIGQRVILQPGVVVGSDGFGYAKNGVSHHKVPQIGRVVIEDDVEIGANSCVDRATTGETRIRRGSKIDNLVQIAHNVVLGEDSVLAAQVGISGSTEVGRGAVIGGQAGLAGHLTIGDGVTVGGQAGVTKSVPSGKVVSGYPARDHSVARRLAACNAMLPALFERVKILEQRLRELEKGGVHDPSAKNDR